MKKEKENPFKAFMPKEANKEAKGGAKKKAKKVLKKKGY
jgi:hypothetical protein